MCAPRWRMSSTNCLHCERERKRDLIARPTEVKRAVGPSGVGGKPGLYVITAREMGHACAHAPVWPSACGNCAAHPYSRASKGGGQGVRASAGGVACWYSHRLSIGMRRVAVDGGARLEYNVARLWPRRRCSMGPCTKKSPSVVDLRPRHGRRRAAAWGASRACSPAA